MNAVEIVQTKDRTSQIRETRSEAEKPRTETRELANGFESIIYGFVVFGTMVSACELGLFGFLSEHPGSTLEQIQAGLNLSLHSTRVLLLGCASFRLIEKDVAAGTYRNSEQATKHLLKESPNNRLSTVDMLHKGVYKPMHYLTESLRAGKNVGLDVFPGEGDSMYERFSSYPELEKVFQDHMADTSNRVLHLLAETAELGSVKSLLDVGGAKAQNAIYLAQRWSGLKVTVLDLDTVCELARANIEAHGLTGTVSTHVGDFYSEPLPVGHDGILFCHCGSFFSSEVIEMMFQKAYDALPEGGRLFYFNAMSNDDGTGPFGAAARSMYFMSLASGVGMVWPPKVFDAACKKAGFRSVTTRELGERTIVIAQK